MATMRDMIGQLIDKVADQAAEIALLKHWQERHKDCITKLETKLEHEREHREQTAQRNQVLQIWKDHFEQQSLAARAILCKAANYTDVAIAFELADLSRDFFAHYPELYPVEHEQAEAGVNGAGAR